MGFQILFDEAPNRHLWGLRYKSQTSNGGLHSAEVAPGDGSRPVFENSSQPQVFVSVEFRKAKWNPCGIIPVLCKERIARRAYFSDRSPLRERLSVAVPVPADTNGMNKPYLPSANCVRRRLPDRHVRERFPGRLPDRKPDAATVTICRNDHPASAGFR